MNDQHHIMEIYLTKDGAQTGPFPLEEVQKMVSAGQSSTTDLCWHSELTEWVPLSGVLPGRATPPPIPTPAAPPNRVQNAEPNVAQAGFCTKCGTKNTEEASFCSSCGNSIKGEQSVKPVGTPGTGEPPFPKNLIIAGWIMALCGGIPYIGIPLSLAALVIAIILFRSKSKRARLHGKILLWVWGITFIIGFVIAFVVAFAAAR